MESFNSIETSPHKFPRERRALIAIFKSLIDEESVGVSSVSAGGKIQKFQKWTMLWLHHSVNIMLA